MLSTTFVMTRRSTVGTAGDCAAARPATRESPPTAKIPAPTAPSRSTSRRLPASPAGGTLEHGRVVKNCRPLNEAHDDLPVKLGHGITGRPDPIGQRVPPGAALADVVAGEILVDERF